MAFPTYREHGVAWCRDVDPLVLLGLFRGTNLGGWNPNENNFNLYTIVIGAQTLHATGYAMGVVRDGAVGTGDPDRDTAVLAFFGDGASSQGDVNESFVWAAAGNLPVVFFCQNNQWAISGTGRPRRAGCRSTSARRGFGFPGVRIDGNDVLASLAVTRKALDDARSAPGPDADRGVHLPDEPAHHLRRPDAGTGSAPRPRRGSSRTRSSGCAPTSPGTPTSGSDFFDEVDDESEALAEHVARRLPGAARPDRRVASFDDVTSRSPTSCASSATSSPPSLIGEVVARDTAEQCAEQRMAKALNEGLRKSAWRTTPRSSSWARTSASSAASSASPTACRRTSARTASSTPRWPSPASSAPRSAWRSAATGRSARSSSTASSSPASTRSSARSPRSTTARRERCSMPITIRIPFGGGIGAVEHHSESPEAYFAHTAGLKVVACSNPSDAYWMIQQAVAADDPVIFFEPKRRYWAKGEIAETPMPLHQARIVRPGRDVTVVAYGPMVTTALEAATAAAEDGHELEVIDLRSLSPLDMPTVLESVRRTGRLIVVHEAAVSFGVGAEIAARVQEQAFYSLEAPVLRVGGYDTPVPAEPARGRVAAQCRSDPRRRRPDHGVLTCDSSSSSCPTSARDSPRPTSSGGRSQSATPSRSTRSSSRSRRPRRRSSCRRRSPAWSPTLHAAEGDTVDVGTPIITIDVAAAAEIGDATEEPAPAEADGERQPVLVGYGPRSEATTRRARKSHPPAAAVDAPSANPAFNVSPPQAQPRPTG